MADMQVCKVCETLDGDKTLKDCIFCSRCKAYICKPDLTRWDRRGRTMIALWGNARGPVDSQVPDPMGIDPRKATRPTPVVLSSGCGGCNKKG